MIAVRFLDAAWTEMVEAAKYYNSKSLGLGTDFLDALQRTVESIGENPLLGEVAHKSIRRKLVTQWPYSVLYQVEQGELIIYAIMHHRRSPNYWHERLKT